jgi:hypothetical protein
VPSAATRDISAQRADDGLLDGWHTEQSLRLTPSHATGRGDRSYRSWYAKVIEEILVTAYSARSSTPALRGDDPGKDVSLHRLG